VKANQSQADGKNNRAAQSKQARKSTGATSATSTAKPARPERERLCRVRVPMPEELAKAVAQAERKLGITKDELFHRAIREQMDRVQTPINEEALDRIRALQQRMDDNNNEARALFFLLTSHLEKGTLSGIGGIEPSESEVCGMMTLGYSITHAQSEIERDLGEIHDELGGEELRAHRLQEFHAEKGGAR
jgi:hypothetical protein